MPISATAEDLRAIARAATDASGYFPAMYSCVTDRIAATIAGGGFGAGPDVDDLACTFASYYTRAYRREVPRPRCWQATWDVAGDRHLLIAQHLILGVNAHVNHDLPLAVVATCENEGLPLEAMRHDFDAVNDVLAATLGDVLGRLDRVSRWTSRVASLGGGRLFDFSLRRARAQAWDAAVRLKPLDEAGRKRYVAELDELVSVLAYLIVHPGWALRALVWSAGRFEEHDARKVTAILLGDA